MKLLLDTCTLLWAWGRPEKLSRRLRGLLRDPQNHVWVSAASAWELSTKHRTGKFPDGGHILVEWEEQIAQDSFRQSAVSFNHALRVGSLPGSHRDPFDRMLAAQSLIETLPVATPDSKTGLRGHVVRP